MLVDTLFKEYESLQEDTILEKQNELRRVSDVCYQDKDI